MAKKYIVLDTETTGLEVKQGHRIIEIGAVLVNNRVKSDQHFHSYLNPQRSIDEKAYEVHGISLESLEDKPLFEEIAAKWNGPITMSTGGATLGDVDNAVSFWCNRKFNN